MAFRGIRIDFELHTPRGFGKADHSAFPHEVLILTDGKHRGHADRGQHRIGPRFHPAKENHPALPGIVPGRQPPDLERPALQSFAANRIFQVGAERVAEEAYRESLGAAQIRPLDESGEIEQKRSFHLILQLRILDGRGAGVTSGYGKKHQEDDETLSHTRL
jgi:hypothetical protein